MNGCICMAVAMLAVIPCLWAQDPHPERTHGGVVATLSLTAGSDEICAGGTDPWRTDDKYWLAPAGQGSYELATRPQSDPHRAAVTATAQDAAGRPVIQQMIKFLWHNPGQEPPVALQATTDNNGRATVYVTSGGSSSFKRAGTVTAMVDGQVASCSIKVLPPTAVWTYKSRGGMWKNWDGRLYGLDGVTVGDVVLVRIMLTWKNKPVTGHWIYWGMDRAFDKWGNVYLPSSPAAPGDLGLCSGFGAVHRGSPGNVWVTDSEGAAFGVYDGHGRTRWGRVDVKATDMNVLVRDALNKSWLNKSYLIGAKLDDLTWVIGTATGAAWETHPFMYPAPSGEEDDELLPETLTVVKGALAIHPESATGYRGAAKQKGEWWFSQGIGLDGASAGTHAADMKWRPVGSAHWRYSGAAFDIVLTSVPIFHPYPDAASYSAPPAGQAPTQAPQADFYPFVQALRNAGIVCCHRWSLGADSKMQSENEVHCIDPACPFIKRYLVEQIIGYRLGLPNRKGAMGYALDYPIAPDQIASETDRATRVRSEINQAYQDRSMGPA